MSHVKRLPALVLCLIAVSAVGCRSADGKRYDYRSLNRSSIDFLKDTFKKSRADRKVNLRRDLDFGPRMTYNKTQRRLGREFLGESVTVGQPENFLQAMRNLGDELTPDRKAMRTGTIFGFLDSGSP